MGDTNGDCAFDVEDVQYCQAYVGGLIDVSDTRYWVDKPAKFAAGQAREDSNLHAQMLVALDVDRDGRITEVQFIQEEEVEEEEEVVVEKSL